MLVCIEVVQRTKKVQKNKTKGECFRSMSTECRVSEVSSAYASHEGHEVVAARQKTEKGACVSDSSAQKRHRPQHPVDGKCVLCAVHGEGRRYGKIVVIPRLGLQHAPSHGHKYISPWLHQLLSTLLLAQWLHTQWLRTALQLLSDAKARRGLL